MDVFQLRRSVIRDSTEFIRSFLHIRDDKIRAVVKETPGRTASLARTLVEPVPVVRTGRESKTWSRAQSPAWMCAVFRWARTRA